jgi:hypothetical protein
MNYKLQTITKTHLGPEGFLDGTCRQDSAREQHELETRSGTMRDLKIGLWIRARGLTGDGGGVDGEEEGSDGVDRVDHLAGTRRGGNCVGCLCNLG